MCALPNEAGISAEVYSHLLLLQPRCNVVCNKLQIVFVMQEVVILGTNKL